MLRWSFATHVGRVREENQDSFLTPQSFGAGKIFGLADGMGGHRGGALASSTMVQECQSFFDRFDRARDGCASAPEDPIGTTVMECLASAHERIAHLNRDAIRAIQEADQQAVITDRFQMGTTGVLLHLADRPQNDSAGVPYTVGWCGDSRMYHYSGRARSLTQITVDHNTTPGSHMLSYVLGIHLFHADTRDGLLLPGDALLMCTDGLTNEVDDAAMAEILTRNRSVGPAEATNDLILAALHGGGRDNITVGVVWTED